MHFTVLVALAVCSLISYGSFVSAETYALDDDHAYDKTAAVRRLRDDNNVQEERAGGLAVELIESSAKAIYL